jgi:hypothetical protein
VSLAFLFSLSPSTVCPQKSKSGTTAFWASFYTSSRSHSRQTLGGYLRGSGRWALGLEARLLMPGCLNSCAGWRGGPWERAVYAWEPSTLKQGPEKPAAWAGGARLKVCEPPTPPTPPGIKGFY